MSDSEHQSAEEEDRARRPFKTPQSPSVVLIVILFLIGLQLAVGAFVVFHAGKIADLERRIDQLQEKPPGDTPKEQSPARGGQ